MKRGIILLWAFTAVAVLSVGILSFRNKPKESCPNELNIASGKDFGGAFTGLDQNGVKVTEQSVIKGSTLMYFGYTYCPDVCPLDTARNARVSDRLGEKNIDLKTVLVTVDPQRDTADVLKDYTKNISDKMTGLTGSDEEINHLKKIYGAYGEKSTGETDPEFYLVDHSAFTYLVTPKGFVAAYDRAQTEEEMTANVLCHAKNGDLD